MTLSPVNTVTERNQTQTMRDINTQGDRDKREKQASVTDRCPQREKTLKKGGGRERETKEGTSLPNLQRNKNTIKIYANK